MFADTSDVHATTLQHCALEDVQKHHASAGLVARQRHCTKADTTQAIATAIKATILGVGAAKAAIQ